MSLRYGERARSGEPVANAGRRQEGVSTVLQPYEQVFTSPGTWTWPGNVSYVEVVVVGGGGGGGYGSPEGPAPTPVPFGIRYGGGGGGGRVRLEYGVPVSAPVPVTVGAGGAAGNWDPSAPLRTAAGVGGQSSFGPTIVAGGGGQGGSVSPTSSGGSGGDAPPTGGGGGGGGNYGPGATLPIAGVGGLGVFGYPGANAGELPNTASPSAVPPVEFSGGGGGAGGGFYRVGAVAGPSPIPTAWGSLRSYDPMESNGQGILGYGGGGLGFSSVPEIDQYTLARDGATYGAGKANTGAGGAGGLGVPPSSGGSDGYAGGSGIVIVRWFE